MDHEHKWGKVQHAVMTGNPHRRCTLEGCTDITLDLHDNEVTNWTVTYAARNANGVAWIGQVTVYADEDTVEEAASEEIRSAHTPPEIPTIILVEFERSLPNQGA